MKLHEFLLERGRHDELSTDDVLASFLPLVRETIQAHRAGFVAPLEGLGELFVEGNRIWFEQARRRPITQNLDELGRLEQAGRIAVEVLGETRRTTEIGDGEEQVLRADIGLRGQPFSRPVYLAGYIAWEHELGHHDPLTDIYSLGLILASLACGLDLNEPQGIESFVARRRNLFALRPGLHPVLAQSILRMTELDRRRRAQDLPAILEGLENYKDQAVDFDIDLANVPGLRSRDPKTRTQAVLTRLRERLFDISRRNTLLHFRPTMGSLNLTQASVPLMLDIQSIREDQLLIWNEQLRRQLVEGKPISLNKHLNFAEAVYLPSLLERIAGDARRDQQELGFAQLRLVLCFLAWANLKVKPAESCHSPLVLLPVKLTKTKGIRDTYHLEPLSADAEINPVLRHQFRQLYDIELPETVDLAAAGLDPLFDYLKARIEASEPAVNVNKVDRPRIDLLHDKARRRLDLYRRNARVSGRGVRQFLDLDYSYDPANYHPLGIKLFSAKIKTPGSRLREIIEDRPRPRSYATAPANEDVVEKERTFYQLRDAGEENPYLWNFDLCSLTLANFRYRRMSLVRDYEAILPEEATNLAFEATFSLAPRPVGRELPAAPPLKERHDVVPCDPTQATAIAEARRGESYIIQGPPGTGKSQTITNLIADFVARGRRVLFVCEKRAAIDVVFARLRQCGLGPLCCLIHDSQTDKKEFVLDLKQTYEGFLAEPQAASSAPRDELLLGIQQHLAPLEEQHSIMEAEDPRAGLPARRLLDRCLSLRAARPELTPEQAERLPHYAEWWSHRDRLEGLETAIHDLAPSGVLAGHPLRFLAPDLAEAERPIEIVTTAVERAATWLDRAEAPLESSGIAADDWDGMERIADLLAYAQRVEPLARTGNLSLADPGSKRAKEFTAALGEARQKEAALVIARKATVAWRDKLPPADLQAALEQARQMDGKLLAWLFPSWWRLRGALLRGYDFRAHQVRPSWVQVLTALSKEYEALDAWEQTSQQTMARFAIERRPNEVGDEISALADWLAAQPERIRRVHQGLVKSPSAGETIAAVLTAEEAAGNLERELANALVDHRRLSLSALRATLIAIGESARQVPQALSLLGDLGGVPPGVGRMLREMPWTLLQAEAAVAHRTWYDLCRRQRPLSRFQGRDRQRHVERIEPLYDCWLAANAQEICRQVAERFLANVHKSVLPVSQLSPADRDFKKAYGQGRRTLEHEFGKSQRFKAIRELVDGESGLVVRDLKPVWLMSPLSVSDTLPLSSDFVDVVIFDEASQVPLEEAVPSLFRGRQVIVVGDEMQLPPTDFFTVRKPADDEELFVDEGEERIRLDLSSDSLLNHAAKYLPATMLGWHYRSKSETLISFSNWAFYDGRLLTVPDEQLPSAASPSVDGPSAASGCELMLSRPLSFHYLARGVYDKRRNRSEAEYIAEVVRDLLRRRSGLSLGVIAFSEAQQEEIESALARLAEEDEEFRRLYDEERDREVDGQFVGLLVKNLENIQGDERDVVVLSVCYGPGPQGKMLMNFGPINQTGGEKRLNVAFSRARRHMAVVASIRHPAITNDYNAGANCLKSYLRYAEATSLGDIDSARRVLSGISRWRDAAGQAAAAPADVLCGQVGEALRGRGCLVEEGVGQSHFRVDLAVRRAEDVSHRLGILIDTPEQYEQSEPLERDVLRPRLLRAFGWRVTTVLAKDWYESPEGEIERVVGLLER